ncbi:uncharacterized protein LOC119680645 [Teleopsis dalmanni]|uniref:uncharacterized protein LOC119680645 n=1 Tax=Teleopsis dalmanni TaxID=139649 RepID=UPI0018CFC000|nr:uncharacterized protein LOC119680645 [Teleopsis dalmanni]
MDKSTPAYSTVQTHSTSRTPSRRSSKTFYRTESLPSPPPPPDLREKSEEIFFKYPPIRKDLPVTYEKLLDFEKRQDEFNKTLNNLIEHGCQLKQNVVSHDTSSQNIDEVLKCACCHQIREECTNFIEPLHRRLENSITGALAAYGAVEQLSRMYSIWDKFLDAERKWHRQKECLNYVNLLQEKMSRAQSVKDAKHSKYIAEADADFENTLALLETILTKNPSIKKADLKQQRERSKSVALLDEHETKNVNSRQRLLRRQSTYSDGKSKVSKWTKVKAAFKWERANVPALMESNKESTNNVGLLPINHEVARYLRVPTNQCGGSSSADSIMSSSSGHILSETGTPGTISSASSMDDIENSCSGNTIRRDSTKSNVTTGDDGELIAFEYQKSESYGESDSQKIGKNESNIRNLVFPKSNSNKSLRKAKAVPEIEVLPEDVAVDIKIPTTRKKAKLPPSPLNLNLKQDLSDVDSYYSPNSLRSPKEGTQSLNRNRKVHSPGNSSVPSSPSRHSDFFVGFESEDLSSGDFSEPVTPSRKTFQQQQDEINLKYQTLRAKLDMEFETKRREWEKLKSNPNTCRALTLISPSISEEHSPNQVISSNLSAKLLEENLTPDFKKKLRKWRVKKQISVGGSHAQHQPPTSPTQIPKIDWNLWKTGQIKLEGQGLTPMPDQKDLPEDFQKKLEQWNKIKRSGGNDSLKRLTKVDIGYRKVTDEDRGTSAEKDKRTDKHKTHEKDKSEKLAKLKAIVNDHPAKKIEVKTSAGVMKFEGISRKFTRKLYEWEKARGIGPEASTFALLHPGYCPIDVGRITKETHNIAENSPTLSRSLSLDSIAPNMNLPIISQQASSLSLNDVNDLKEMESGISSSGQLLESEFKKFEEPEAVMVEVEDHIVETASPLITANTLVEHQTPVYKYEEVACNDYCNTKRIQSYESHTNLAPLLAALKRTDEIIAHLEEAAHGTGELTELQKCKCSLLYIRSVYPYYTENLMKSSVLNAISDVQIELGRLSELSEKSPLNEACCQEIMEERFITYKEEIRGLHESLEMLHQNITVGIKRYPKDIVPDINITSDDGHNAPIHAVFVLDSSNPGQEPSVVTMCSAETSKIDQMNSIRSLRNVAENSVSNNSHNSNINSNNNSNSHSNGNVITTPSSSSVAVKKKLRLRKMGSRQNSKTESDSSDNETQNIADTPRRLKRKNFRLKQRSLDEDSRKIDEQNCNPIADDMVYVLKVKPGKPIEQLQNVLDTEKCNYNVAIPTLMEPYSLHPKQMEGEKDIHNSNTNIFVQTKRKIFTTIDNLPNTIDGIAVISEDIDNPSQSDKNNIDINRAEHQSDKELIGTIGKGSESNNFETIQPRLLLRKSLSLIEIGAKENDDEVKYYSNEDVRNQKSKSKSKVRPPLASDSFRVINKSYIGLPKDVLKLTINTVRKPHLYKKNSDKFALLHARHNNGGTIKRIETKFSKSNSGTAVDQINLLTPTKINNGTLTDCRTPERKSLTPTINPVTFEYPTTICSEPTTPLLEQINRPHTPLSERAQRLQKAKEDFLQGTVPRVTPHYKRRDEIVRNDTWEQYRRSDHSLSSATGDENNLGKSLSVDTITAETTTLSDAGTDQDFLGYDSLPRHSSVSRSGKISSKLGFATLASKFRRVKGKKEPSTGNGSSSALSALCRQTLLADGIAIPQMISTNAKPGECVIKSQSSPQAISATALMPHQRRENERLNKSQSEQYVKPQKESCV